MVVVEGDLFTQYSEEACKATVPAGFFVATLPTETLTSLLTSRAGPAAAQGGAGWWLFC